MATLSGTGFCPWCKANTVFREGSSQPWPADDMASVVRCERCGLEMARLPEPWGLCRGQWVTEDEIAERHAAGEFDPR